MNYLVCHLLDQQTMEEVPAQHVTARATWEAKMLACDQANAYWTSDTLCIPLETPAEKAARIEKLREELNNAYPNATSL